MADADDTQVSAGSPLSPGRAWWQNWPEVALRCWFILVLGFLFAPLALVAVFSFNDSEIGALPLRGFTTRWYLQMFANRDIQAALVNSLLICGVTVVVSTILGVLAAYGTYRFVPSLRQVLGVIGTLPILVPRLILGIALLTFFNLIRVDLSLTTVIIGHTIIAFPYVFLIVSARLSGFNVSQWEAASDLGANAFQVFWKITIPALKPAIIGSALLSITLSIDEVVVTFFTIGTENTLPILIWSMLRYGISPEINALATLMIIVSSITAFIAEMMIRKSQ